jgi:hypothetical protein
MDELRLLRGEDRSADHLTHLSVSEDLLFTGFSMTYCTPGRSKSHPSLGPKVTVRWITVDQLHQLVKMQLVNPPVKDLDLNQFNRGLIAHPILKEQITRQKNCVGL